jgi:hypothetical protein
VRVFTERPRRFVRRVRRLWRGESARDGRARGHNAQ